MHPSVPGTITALHDAYATGRLRPSETVEAWLARPESDRGAPVFLAAFTAQHLRQRAAALDAELARDAHIALKRPLFGALFAVKDNIDVDGLPTTAACPAFARMPARSASVVAALEDAGAICVGKTNLDQFATGLVGTRSPYGAVSNAFDGAYISGGSSSGSAVAVALGHVHFSLGTDTAGSGRVPASFNNIVGWKPTRGAISTRGVVPACESLDCVSIFALTVGDAATVAGVAMGADQTDAKRLRVALTQPRWGGAFRFGVPEFAQREFFGDARAAAAFEAAIVRLTKLGGVAVPVDFSAWRAAATMLYEGPWVAERHAAIREFFDAQPDALDPSVRSIIAGARRFTATDAFVAQSRLRAMQGTLSAVWKNFDVLLVPSAPTIYKIADVAAEPLELNRRLGTYTNFVNLLDLAALAVPAALRDDGLPFGITLIGPAGSDYALAELGDRFHRDTGLPLGATGLPQPSTARSLPGGDVARIAVVGAHLSGLPLNRELTERGARLVRTARTAPSYRLYALPGTVPEKPGLVRCADRTGQSIALEVWEMSVAAFGAFVAGIPSPLGIGTIELDDGSRVQGFLCEAIAVVNAPDISSHGGWRAYLAARTPASIPVVEHT